MTSGMKIAWKKNIHALKLKSSAQGPSADIVECSSVNALSSMESMGVGGAPAGAWGWAASYILVAKPPQGLGLPKLL